MQYTKLHLQKKVGLYLNKLLAVHFESLSRICLVAMAPILEVVLVIPESLKPRTELSPASNVFRHVVEWVRLVLLTEYDNVMDIRMFHNHHRSSKFGPYITYRLKKKAQYRYVMAS